MNFSEHIISYGVVHTIVTSFKIIEVLIILSQTNLNVT
jgi:hypothetical protein